MSIGHMNKEGIDVLVCGSLQTNNVLRILVSTPDHGKKVIQIESEHSPGIYQHVVVAKHVTLKSSLFDGIVPYVVVCGYDSVLKIDDERLHDDYQEKKDK